MTAQSAPGWAWLSVAPVVPGSNDLATAFARCFGDEDGQRVLGHLRALTLERTLGPDAPDNALRHLEGQRQLVLAIQTLVARGRAGPISRPPAESVGTLPAESVGTLPAF
ncbi:MAG: hypothetical protein WCK65_14450 [Rhodospirillaceae bacterium]